MRVLGIIVIILGLAGLVFGIIFLPQASSAKTTIANELAPVTISELNAKYDAVTAVYNKTLQAEGPAIAAQTAGPSVNFAYFAGQRALLGLAKSNLATVNLLKMLAVVNMAVGVGLVLTGIVLVRKTSA